MDANDKLIKSCAIKVHLANIINRKSHVTLVVPELCTGLTIKTTAIRKIGMNEQQARATSLFLSAKDSYKSFSNLDENDGASFFHVQDVDMPGQYVNLRFCEFHLYWKESLPNILEKSINISQFRSHGSAEEKSVLAVNSKPISGHRQPNGPIKSASFLKTAQTNKTNNIPQMALQNQSRSNLSEKVERKPMTRGNSFNSIKKLPEKTEPPNVNKDARTTTTTTTIVGSNYNLTSEIKRRPSLSSVKEKMKGLNLQDKQTMQTKEETKESVRRKPNPHEACNSPSSSYSSSSVEMKHSLSSSMPVLNKIKLKDFQNILNKKNLSSSSSRKRVESKSNVSVDTHDPSTGERLSSSRRQLPQVSISERDVEEKRHLLSKQLEKRLIRRATLNETKGGTRRPLHKTQSLLGWKEKSKSCNEDSDDSRSLASQEVAEIMAEAGPMGVVESDYEEPASSDREEEEEEEVERRSDPEGKNVFLSLFDSMTIDLINESSDPEISEESSRPDASSSCGKSRSEADDKSRPKEKKKLAGCPARPPPKSSEFQSSSRSSFTVYSDCKRNRRIAESRPKLTLFDLLRPGVLRLLPITVRLSEKHPKVVRPSKVLPFRVSTDAVELSSSRNDFGVDGIGEPTRTFEALKITSVDADDAVSLDPTSPRKKFREPQAFRPGDLLIEINDINVLGYTESQFSELEASVLSRCNTLHMVIARPSRNL